MKKNIETIKKNQSEMKTAISKIKNTLEGINTRSDEAEAQKSDLEDKVGNSTQAHQQKEEGILKNEKSLRNILELTLLESRKTPNTQLKNGQRT